MKNVKIGFVIWCIVASLLAVGVVSYTVYGIVVSGEVNSRDLFKALLVLCGLGATLVRIFAATKQKKVSDEVLRESYDHIIGNAFLRDRAMEKRFFKAVRLRNQDQYGKAIRIFGKMEPLCKSSDERFAVIFFEALCYGDMNFCERAAALYESALTYRENSTAASNMGNAYERLGRSEDAVSAYRYAIRIEPKNPYPYNNLAQLYIKEGNYPEAIVYAEQALTYKDNMVQAWNALTVAYAMMEYTEDYEQALHRAVANGSDRERLLSYIRSLGADVS